MSKAKSASSPVLPLWALTFVSAYRRLLVAFFAPDWRVLYFLLYSKWREFPTVRQEEG